DLALDGGAEHDRPLRRIRAEPDATPSLLDGIPVGQRQPRHTRAHRGNRLERAGLTGFRAAAPSAAALTASARRGIVDPRWWADLARGVSAPACPRVRGEAGPPGRVPAQRL